ncbi:hypothetical protein DL95DRAFT_469847 [Leptodontidium sp. 2 PMI_412]|nr:hypothetical protein DL95DRAFT_469847 [Leptodontidium sp. 2 PMI_412]
MSSSTSIADSIRPLSIYEESIRTPQQWDSIYSQAAKVARSPDPLVDDNTPIMERNIRKTRRSHPPTSTRYFPVETGEPSPTKRDTSSTRSGPGNSSATQQNKTNLGVEIVQAMCKTHGNRVATFQYLECGMRLLSPPNDLNLVPGRFSSQGVELEIQVEMHPKPSKNEASTGDTSSSNPFADGAYALPSLITYQPNDCITANERPPHARKSAGLKSLRVAAKAAFSKHSAAPDSGSPTESFVSAVEYPQTLRPEASKRAQTTSILDTKNNISAKQILGEAPPTLVQDFAIPKKSNRKSIHPPSTQGNRLGKSGSSSSNS